VICREAIPQDKLSLFETTDSDEASKFLDL